MKYIITFIFFYLSFLCFSQVGINTKNPTAMLDVNGSVRIRKQIQLGGSDSAAGASGIKGESILVSRGLGLSPEWKVLGGQNEYVITDSSLAYDEKGVIIQGGRDLTEITVISENEQIIENSNSSLKWLDWKEITGLQSPLPLLFSPRYTNNRLVVSFQTVVQSGSHSAVDIVVAGGVFVDGELKSTRSVLLSSSGLTSASLEIFDVFENLPPKPKGDSYKVQIAVKIRYFAAPPGAAWTSKMMAMGTSTIDMVNSNPFMNSSSLKIDLYEKPE